MKNSLLPNIFLTGFMGSGKSAIGRLIAERLEYEFIDIDEIIERQTGKSIVDIFSEQGESFFRTIEKETLNKYAGRHNVVISLGGGTLIDHENLTPVKQNGILIHLEASPEAIWSRIKSTNKRPLLQKPDGSLVADRDAVEHIKRLLNIRWEGYSQADIHIPSENKREDEIVSYILEYFSGDAGLR